MTFLVETSTIPGTIGAGKPPSKFVDYTHVLRFENAETGDTAEALATFGKGQELSDAALWAERAHGLDLVAVDEFDAKAEHKRRKAEAEALADDMAGADDQAKALIRAAEAEAARLEREAKDQAKMLIHDAKQEAAEIVKAARDEAIRIVNEAKDQAAQTVEAAKKEAADLKKQAEKGGK
jgi:hypothetical protein